MNKRKIFASLLLVNLGVTGFGPFIAATSVNDLQNDVDSANETIDKNESTIDENQAEISDLSEQITEVESKLEEKRSELEEVNTSISDLEASIDELETSIKEKESSIKDLEKSIDGKSSELKELQVELEQNKKMSSAILLALQKNSNVNYVMGMLTSDDDTLIDKLNTLNGLNRLANDSFDIISDTISVTREVEAAKTELETQKSGLQTEKTNLQEKQDDLKSQNKDLKEKQETLATQSEELVSQSQELSQKEDDLASEITRLTNVNADQKAEMLENANLLEKYENAGCTGDDVYGEDCAVPVTEKVVEKQEAAQEDVVVEETEETTSDSTSYVAKLKADPDANYIINRESGWNPYATNPTSGAYGICQSLPGTKMASAGADWATNIETQAKWCDSYVAGRYGSWANARAFWDANNWF